MDALNNAHSSSANTSGGRGMVSPGPTLHGNHPLDTASHAVHDTPVLISSGENEKPSPDSNVFVVDWDGPADPKNPRK